MLIYTHYMTFQTTQLSVCTQFYNKTEVMKKGNFYWSDLLVVKLLKKILDCLNF